MSTIGQVWMIVAVFLAVWAVSLLYDWRMERSRRRYFERMIHGERGIPPQSPLESSQTRQEGK